MRDFKSQLDCHLKLIASKQHHPIQVETQPLADTSRSLLSLSKAVVGDAMVDHNNISPKQVSVEKGKVMDQFMPKLLARCLGTGEVGPSVPDRD